MAKSKSKKLRKKARKARRPNTAKRCDKHHIFYQRKDYEKSKARVLRNYEYCSAVIPMDTLHRAIHREVFSVPVPEEKVVKRALRQLDELWEAGAISTDDSIEKRLRTLVMLFADAPATKNALLAQLAVCKKYPRS